MNPFAQWIEKPVILQVKAGNSRATLEGSIIDDATNSLHFQPHRGRRILLIPKSCVLAIEEAPRTKACQSRPRHWEIALAS